jgi:hypothetical protein
MSFLNNKLAILPPFRRLNLLGSNRLITKTAVRTGGPPSSSVPPIFPPARLIVPVNPAASDVRNKALMILAGLALSSSALGGGLAALRGFRKTVNPEIPDTPPTEVPIGLPYPQEKRADIPLFSPKWFAGQSALTPAGIPWFLPAAAATIGFSAKGSSKLVNKLIQARQKEQMERELSGAEKDLTNAILEQFDPNKVQALQKSSAINEALDKLYELLEKKAVSPLSPTAGNRIGMLTGGSLTIGGLLAYLAAKGGYRFAHGQTQEDLLRKALQNKALLKSLQSPTPISVQPILIDDDRA